MPAPQGLAALAVLAAARGVVVQVVPVGLGYSQVRPERRSRAAPVFWLVLHVMARAISGEGPQ